MPAKILAIANDAPAIVVNPNSAAASPTSRKIAALFNIGIPQRSLEQSVFRFDSGQRSCVPAPGGIAMAQKSNAPGTNEPRASVPQELDDELEMANDDEDFEDDEEVDEDSELDDEDVEE
jgi:hypothetical protein